MGLFCLLGIMLHALLRISVKTLACHKLGKVPKTVQQIGSCGMPKKNQGTVRDLQAPEANGG